jgi:hypothetical protein
MYNLLRRWRLPGAIGTALIVSLLVMTPALAQSSTDGNITLDNDVKGNQYLFGNSIVVNGAVDGDVMAFGRSLTINGPVTGDVLFAGQWLLVTGKVDGDVRGAGAILVLDKDAQVSGDLVAAGYAVEMRPGSNVGGQALLAGAQLAVESISGDVKAGAQSLRINGAVGGNVDAGVGSPDQSTAADPFAGMRGQDPNMPVTSTLPGGLSFGPDGKIKGNLDYASSKESQLPSGVVGGKTAFTLEVTDQQKQQQQAGFFGSQLKGIVGYFFASLIALTILGVLMQKFGANFVNGTVQTLRERILASLGVGLLGYIVFFGLLLVLFILLFVLVLPLSFLSMGQRFFGAITLTSFGVGTLFIAVTNWLAPIILALLIGEWLYGQINRERKSPFWSLVIGLVVVLLALSIPVVGRSLIGGLVAVLGLGAAVLYLWPRRPVTVTEAPPPVPAPAAK